MTRSALLIATAVLAIAVPSAFAVTLDYEADIKQPSTWTGFQFSVGDDSGKEVRRVTLQLSPGAVFRLRRAPLCAAAPRDRFQQGHAAVCPAESMIGTGEARATFDSGTVTHRLELWNARTPSGPAVFVERYDGDTRLVPAIALSMRGTIATFRYDDGSPETANSVEFDVDVDAQVLRTPPCTRRRGANRARFSYDDGTRATAVKRVRRCRS